MELSPWVVPEGELWTFPQLPEVVRDDVQQLADDGRLHPDPDIAAITVRWALVVRSGVGRLRSWATFGTGVAVTVVGPNWLPGPSWVKAFRDNQLAKRVLRVAICTDWSFPKPLAGSADGAELPASTTELRQPISVSELIRRN